MEAFYKNIHQEIIDQCKEGDQKAQFQLYRLYSKSMYNVSRRIVGNDFEAEDVMQESFLKAYKKIDMYEGKVSFGVWLRKIVINCSLDAIKKRKMEFGELSENMPDNMDYNIGSEVTIDQVKKAIEKLPEGYRLVLNLYLIEGYDHEEISQILNISNATSRTQYHRAKRKLRDILKADKIFSMN